MEKIDFQGTKRRIWEAPDPLIFKMTKSLNTHIRLKLGYVGTFREDKRFKKVLEPVLDKLKSILELRIVGKAGQERIPHERMVTAYNDMDVLAMPSRFEGAPLPPLEAALCGRSTVGTKCGDLEEVFDFYSATLFDALDDENTSKTLMEEAIIELYEHREDLVQKGEIARDRVMELRSWEDNVINDYDNMFEEVANE